MTFRKQTEWQCMITGVSNTITNTVKMGKLKILKNMQNKEIDEKILVHFFLQ